MYEAHPETAMRVSAFDHGRPFVLDTRAMSESMPPPKSQVLAVMTHAFRDGVPHNAALGLQLLDVGPGDGYAAIRLPYSEQLVGDPETGVLHGGAITALLDATCGAAMFMKLAKPVAIATLDLRIDYLKPATPGLSVIARADTIKLTRNVGFVRAFAYHDDPEDPIASATATFMIGTKGQSVAQREATPPVARGGEQ
jgi:uncharacterized protein (TIGR00369 family)